MKKLFLLTLFTYALFAKEITPNDVYAQSILIQNHVHFLLKEYAITHNCASINKRTDIHIKLKPRNTWQKSYEILIKINMLRKLHDLPRITPVGMEAVEVLNPHMVYEQTQRILTEIKIFEVRENLNPPELKLEKFENKSPLDVYNSFSHISAAFDELNGSELSSSYVFAQTMRIYDDLTMILNHLNIKDETIPTKRMKHATSEDSLDVSMKALKQIKILQESVGIATVDFSSYKKELVTPSDVYSITGAILAELQTIKAYIGLTRDVTPPAFVYSLKSSSDIEQLMQWNLRKIKLIEKFDRR